MYLTEKLHGLNCSYLKNNFACFPIEIDAFFLFCFAVFRDISVVALSDILNKTLFQLIFFSFVNIFLSLNTNLRLRMKIMKKSSCLGFKNLGGSKNSMPPCTVWLGCFKISKNFRWLKFLSDQSNSYSLFQILSRNTKNFEKC